MCRILNFRGFSLKIRRFLTSHQPPYRFKHNGPNQWNRERVGGKGGKVRDSRNWNQFRGSRLISDQIRNLGRNQFPIFETEKEKIKWLCILLASRLSVSKMRLKILGCCVPSLSPLWNGIWEHGETQKCVPYTWEHGLGTSFLSLFCGTHCI